MTNHFVFLFLKRLFLKRLFQFNSRTVSTHFASVMTLNNSEMIAETQSYIFRGRSRCFNKLAIRSYEGVMVKILWSFFSGNFTLWTGWICSLFQTLSAARHIQTAEKVLYDITSTNCLCAFAHPNVFCRSEVRQLGVGAMFIQEYVVCCRNRRNIWTNRHWIRV